MEKIEIDIDKHNLPFSYLNWELKTTEKGIRKIRFKNRLKEKCFGAYRFYKKIL